MEKHIFFKKLFSHLKVLVFLLVIPIVVGIYLGLYFTQKEPEVYSSKLTIYPESPSNSSPNISSTISQFIVGGDEGGGSFRNASTNIGISYLATSDPIMNELGLMKPPNSNKTYAELSAEKINASLLFYQKKKKIDIPIAGEQRSTISGNVMRRLISPNMNSKQNILTIYINTFNEELLQPLAKDYFNILSKFYKQNKLDKLYENLRFLENKRDSAKVEQMKIEVEMIKKQNTTLYANEEDLEYLLPKEKLEVEKERITGFIDGILKQITETKWNIQKETPMMKILEFPQKPYSVSKASKLFNCSKWALITSLLFSLLFLSPLLIRGAYSFIKKEIENLQKPEEPTYNNSSTSEN